jgi:hypothetical protein
MPADRAATILARFTATYSLLASKLRDLPPGVAEHSPDLDSWSPAQVGCHVAMSNAWISGVLTGATTLADPIPEGFTERFSPNVLPPTEETFPDLVPARHVSREAALERLRTSYQTATRAIASLSADRGAGQCVTLTFGTLSLFELADFAATHMTRHMAQVDRTVGARL